MKEKVLDLKWNWWDFWFKVFMCMVQWCLNKQEKICVDHRRYLEEQANEQKINN